MAVFWCLVFDFFFGLGCWCNCVLILAFGMYWLIVFSMDKLLTGWVEDGYNRHFLRFKRKGCVYTDVSCMFIMTTRNIIIIILGKIFLLVTILFVGQYVDPQDGDITFFIKHKPTFKQTFYSPVAYHRLFPTTLTYTEEIEEKSFKEYVADRNLLTAQTNSLIFSTSIFQLSLTLLICGLFSLFSKRQISIWQLFLHFIINSIATNFLGIVNILYAENLSNIIGVLILLLLLNILTIFPVRAVLRTAHQH